MTESAGKRTALYERHVGLGAKMVPFAGYVMPLSYAGQLAEHEAVRGGMGLFDLSHMGEFRLTGPDALAAVPCAGKTRGSWTISSSTTWATPCSWW